MAMKTIGCQVCWNCYIYFEHNKIGANSYIDECCPFAGIDPYSPPIYVGCDNSSKTRSLPVTMLSAQGSIFIRFTAPSNSYYQTGFKLSFMTNDSSVSGILFYTWGLPIIKRAYGHGSQHKREKMIGVV